MHTEIKEFNSLPAKTWRWLGVNGGPAVLDAPEPHGYTREALAAPAPEGAEISSCPGAAPEEDGGLPLHPGIRELMASKRNAGRFVRIPAGRRIEAPVVLDYRLGGENPAVLDDNLILAEEGSSVTVMMHYAGGPGGLHCGQTRLIARKGAVIRLIQLQSLSADSRNFDNVAASAGEDASIEVIQAELGGKNTYANCHTRLDGAGSRFTLDVLYFGDGDRTFDLNVVSDQYGRKTRSDIAAHGALLDRSDKIFRGTIDFKKGSAGSVGREDEKTMLFSPQIRNRTAPLIMCAEEDVDGRHSASAGRVNENQLFYLMTRGLSSLEAKKLLIEAEFQPVVDKIPLEAYRREISDFLRERLKNVE